MIGKLPIVNAGRGTEYMCSVIDKHVFGSLKNLHKYNWVVLPIATDEDMELAKSNPTIIWMHVPSSNLENISIRRFFTNQDVLANTAAYIFQSEFHKADIINEFGLDQAKCFVLNNTFEEVPPAQKPSGRVNLVYVQQPARGLDILLDALKLIKDKNISLTFHGCACSVCSENKITEEITDKRVTTLDYTSKERYIKTLQDAHLLIYPCTFHETAGISLMEAMSAGIKIVTTDLGAIPETTMGYAKLIRSFPKTSEDQLLFRKKYVKVFKKEIEKAVKEIRKGRFDPSDQIRAVKERYGLEVIKQQWVDFDAKM